MQGGRDASLLKSAFVERHQEVLHNIRARSAEAASTPSALQTPLHDRDAASSRKVTSLNPVAPSIVSETQHISSSLASNASTQQQNVVVTAKRSRGKYAFLHDAKRGCAAFGKKAGGWVWIATVPLLIFVSTVILLYATAPSFVRKKSRDELEMPGIDHAKVFVIAGICAGVALLGTITWTAVAMRTK